MTSDLDVFRTAHVLVREHGEAAATEAAMRADRMLERGDMQARGVRLRVVKAAEVLLRQTPEGLVH